LNITQKQMHSNPNEKIQKKENLTDGSTPEFPHYWCR
jgi:hypothetical protein